MAGERIERAKLFATLIALAVRGLSSVDARFFGFTGDTIYDAGDAHRCAAHALEPGGGNNDAAALWHAASLALRSPRRSRLLVMVSDGSPTECTVAALKALALRLTRRMGIACVQAAVAPLDAIAFPHHVAIEGDDLATATRRFGGLVARLLRSTAGR
ncbi:MAG: hypothetical protein HY720_02375 [Planctomycetes bacterium]|nr:hypothetical protein [Planctomycetota bacterium]